MGKVNCFKCKTEMDDDFLTPEAVAEWEKSNPGAKARDYAICDICQPIHEAEQREAEKNAVPCNCAGCGKRLKGIPLSDHDVKSRWGGQFSGKGSGTVYCLECADKKAKSRRSTIYHNDLPCPR